MDEQPHSNYYEEDWQTHLAQLIHIYRPAPQPSTNSTYYLGGVIKTKTTTAQFPRVEIIIIHHFMCKGLMIQLDHCSRWDCVVTHTAVYRKASLRSTQQPITCSSLLMITEMYHANYHDSSLLRLLALVKLIHLSRNSIILWLVGGFCY